MRVAPAAVQAAARLDLQKALLYTDLIVAALGKAARKAVEGLMANGTYEYQSDFARKYYGQGKAEGEAKGKAEGKAEAIVAFLRARGMDVSAEAEATIRACTDHERLDRWLKMAATATSPDDLLA